MADARQTKVQPSQQERARRARERPRRQVGDGYDVAGFRRAIARGVRAANAQRLRLHVLALAAQLDKPLDSTARRRIERLSVAAVTDDRGGAQLRRATFVALFDRASDLEEIEKSCAELPLIETFAPNRLRHSAATRLRREEGLEAARVVLGHARAAVTEIYAEVDHERSREIAERLG